MLMSSIVLLGITLSIITYLVSFLYVMTVYIELLVIGVTIKKITAKAPKTQVRIRLVFIWYLILL